VTRRPAWLAAPLLLVLLLAFVAPIGAFLLRGVQDTAVAPAFARTVAALQGWSGQTLPDAPAWDAAVADMRAARDAGTLLPAAARLNSDIAGLRTVVTVTARKLAVPFAGSARDALLAADPAWGQIETWGAVRRAARSPTDYHLLAALDLKRDAAGDIQAVPPGQRVFRLVFVRTFGIAALVTAACLLLGYPVAAFLARHPGRLSRVLMLAVLLPFWTSLIVRTAAWMVLLARDGVVNGALVSIGVFGAPQQLLYNRFAVVLAMVHILLPSMILPLHAVMAQVPPALLRAASSLGAGPIRSFWRVWLPQTIPGIAAGCVLVFIQALGFYVTPALLGGGADQMLPWFIGFYANQTVDWGLAAALSLVLLAAIGALAAIWARFGPGMRSLAP